MSRRTQKRGGCDSCRMAGCLECKAGGRLGVYGGSYTGPSDTPLDECAGCAPSSIAYFNLSLFNPAGASASIRAQITDTRSTAILDVPDDWEMSVVRFDVSAQLLPPIVAPMTPLPPPPPDTQPTQWPSLLTVTLTFGGVNFEQAVQIAFNGPDTFGYVFSFDELAVRINAALAAAFAAIPAKPAGSVAPYLWFDPATQLFKLFYQTANYGVAPLIEIWVSQELYKYIASMPAFFAGINQPFDKDFRLQVETTRTGATLIPTPPGPGFPVGIQTMTGTLAFLSQEGVSLASTNGVRSIFITSTLLPTNPESLPATFTPDQSANYTSNSIPILSDFLITTDPAANPVVDRISVSYLPTAEYRMIQLRGRSPVKQVDISFFFTLFDGTVKPLFLFPGGYCSAKILFRRSARSTLKDSRGA